MLSLLVFTALTPAAFSQDLSILVNLPAYRLDVYDGDEHVRSYPIAIGSTAFETPMGAFDVRYVEWNPWWHPPDAAWARNERVTPPGPRNPMGRAKIEFLPNFYIHGSSQPLKRAVSHGCIRMANHDVLELARMIAEASGANISDGQMDHLENHSRQTHRVRLANPVRVRVVYRLTEEIDGETVEYRDVYKLD